MYSFFKTTPLVSWQPHLLALLTPKNASRLMGSTLMAMLALLAFSPVAKAENEDNSGLNPEITQPDPGSDPEISPPDISILPIDEGGRFPGWWMPRNLYFSFDPQTKAIQTFNEAPPILNGEVTLGNNGLYYGVNAWGGNEGSGSIYSLNPEDNRQEELASFSPAYGSFPHNLTLGNNGSFYGTTYYGGDNNGGSIFKFNPNGNILEENIASFEGIYEEFYAEDGSSYSYSYSGLPSALTLGQNGIFYGTTGYGGEKQGGSIFAFDPANNQLSTIFNFEPFHEEGIDYSYSYSISPSVLTLADNGLLYGTTFYGGDHNTGSIFSFDPTQGEVTIVANFESFFDANGIESFPSPSSLTLGSDGLLYGTTSAGGDANLGTIFAFDPNSNALSTAVDFNVIYDENNFAFRPSPRDLKMGSDGLLYGTLYDQSIYYLMREDTLGNNPAVVPEPLTLLGTITAVNFGVFFKNRRKKAAKKS